MAHPRIVFPTNQRSCTSCTTTVAPVDHAVVMVLDQAGVFGQAFSQKGCDHAASKVFGFDQTFLKSL